MRKLRYAVMSTLDGFFDGTGTGLQRIDWFRADQEWLDYSVEQLKETGVLLFGRRTFEGMASYWPNQTDAVAQYMNGLPKVGFSRTERDTDWQNARFAQDARAEVERLKREPGQDLLIYGSADLAASLTAVRLIDEYLVAVNPVAIGAGTPLFPPGVRTNFERVGTREFASGIVQVKYRLA